MIGSYTPITSLQCPHLDVVFIGPPVEVLVEHDETWL